MPDPTLTAPQARALRFYGAPQPRSARRLELGGAPRWDVVRRLLHDGLLEPAGDPTMTTDHRLTEAGRAQLVVEAGRRGWSLPWHRHPYVGDGADGARRSAQIDREEADTLDRVAHAPGIERLLASAERWEAQAAELETLERPAGDTTSGRTWHCGACDRDVPSWQLQQHLVDHAAEA